MFFLLGSSDYTDIIRKQKATISSLSEDHKELTRALSLHQTIPRDVEFKLQTEKDNLAHEERKLLIETKVKQESKSSELDATIELLRQRILTAKSVAAKTTDSESVSKYITVLEKRLDRSLIRFNELVHSNSVLRDQVDSLRREKQTHSEIEKRLQSEILQFKKMSNYCTIIIIFYPNH